MNWSKAKTILIVFLLLTNSILLFHIVHAARTASVVAQEVVDAAVQILERNQVSIDAALIPRKNVTKPIPTVQNCITGYEAFSARMLGTKLTKGEGYVYFNDAGAMRFRGDRFTFIPASSTSQGLNQEDSYKNQAKALVEKLGISLFGAHIQQVQDGDNARVVFSKTIAGQPFFDCIITVYFNMSGVEKMEGSWFEEQDRPLIYEKFSMKSAPGALMDFCASASKPNTPVTISGLEFGYVVGDAAKYHETIQLKPVWRIQTENQEEFLMDAI